ncbi:c-type cytochrome biogenesis protein CcmI [Thioalkalivibrio paradoxus]|uniref:Cytochrome c-type biogenesis protein H TPR domain-containing protein n=1 Tax=Thioalkalivibrio paradoxus ARh 1 TaxID=713585 RepID=W0DSR6_9GAMM|nr:c-type cytochrome biogenesis protein CcmI [Thioalkalivibrio paradoxus]AHF00029.1 hypothetical protein THITH_06875 [Thioalkalivibrio paradoxus ARh 1]
MTVFWSIAAVLTAVSLLFLFVPMLRARAVPQSEPVSNEGSAAAVDVYRAQLAELEADREAGTISEAQYTTARLDLQRSLLEMSEAREAAGSRRLPGSWRWPTGIASLVVVPVLAVLIYQGYGSGAAGLDPQLSAPQQTAGAEPGMDGSIEAAVQALSARLEANPVDPEGWALLGRSLLFLEQPRAAAGAYAQAIRHGGNEDPDILTSYADLLGSLDGGNLAARAKPFIDQALAIEPNHVNGLWLAGLAAFRSSEYPEAQEYWERLASQFEPGSEEAGIIRSNLDEVEERLRDGAAESPSASAGN